MRLFDLGIVDFNAAWQLQKNIFSQVRENDFSAAVILCRHHPVITLGRNTKKDNILAGEETLRQNSIALYKVERGGDATYHGIGQLTAYPILNLHYFKKDINWYLRKLEDIIISCLSDFGVRGEKRKDLTGVWVEGKKIASIGIAIKQWITFHGLSINISSGDLENFRFIRPCGMDIEMTSLESVLGRPVSIEDVKLNLILKFQEARREDGKSCSAGIRRRDN